MKKFKESELGHPITFNIFGRKRWVMLEINFFIRDNFQAG